MYLRIVLKVLFVVALVWLLRETPARADGGAQQCCDSSGFPCDFQACMDACAAAGWPVIKCQECCPAQICC